MIYKITDENLNEKVELIIKHVRSSLTVELNVLNNKNDLFSFDEVNEARMTLIKACFACFDFFVESYQVILTEEQINRSINKFYETF